MVTIVNSGTDPIDIPIATLLQYTNCTQKDQACSLLEMAIATSSLQMLVMSNDNWKTATASMLRGVPIINTETLLHHVIPTQVGEKTCFPTSSTTLIDDVTYSIQIHVDPDPVTVSNGPTPVSQDFALASLQTDLERAYKIRFALTSADGEEEIPRYWVGYFNASPRMSVPTVSGYKRRKITPCEEEEDA